MNMWIERGVRQVDGAFAANDAPIGGVKFLLDAIFKLNNRNNFIIPVFEKSPTIKREMYKRLFGDEYGYKGKRPPKKKGINEQKTYAEWVLNDLGYPCYDVEGYEADDVIYSLVLYLHDEFDEIRIYTRDSDLYFLVDDKVSLYPVTRQDKIININNYEDVCNRKVNTPYNVHHLRKLCSGDTADNIPGVGKAFAEYFDACIEDSSQYKMLGDLDYCRSLISKVIERYPTMPNAHKILPTFNILMPLKIPEEMLLPVPEFSVDIGKLYYYKAGWSQKLGDSYLESALQSYIDSYCEAE